MCKCTHHYRETAESQPLWADSYLCLVHVWLLTRTSSNKDHLDLLTVIKLWYKCFSICHGPPSPKQRVILTKQLCSSVCFSLQWATKTCGANRWHWEDAYYVCLWEGSFGKPSVWLSGLSTWRPSLHQWKQEICCMSWDCFHGANQSTARQKIERFVSEVPCWSKQKC